MTDPTPEQTAAQLWHLALSSTGNEFIAAAEAAIYAAIRAAELAQAERDAALCDSHWYDTWNGKLKDASGFISNTAWKAYSAAIRESIHEPEPVP